MFGLNDEVSRSADPDSGPLVFPKKSWNKLHLLIIYYGREFCKARECYGLTCKICTT